MERRYFKLERGYLNIDAEAMIFTRSGNWQEAASAKERMGWANVGRSLRLVTGFGLILIGGVFLSVGELRHALHEGSIVLAVGLAGFGAYKMYQLLNDDLGHRFRIPFAKVTGMSIEKGLLTVCFLNGAFKEDTVHVKVRPEAALFAETTWRSTRDDTSRSGTFVAP